MITLEFEVENFYHISVCDLLIPKVAIICHVMWVCPHRSVSCINYGTYTCRSLKYQQNILDIIPHSLVPRLPCSLTKIPFRFGDIAVWE